MKSKVILVILFVTLAAWTIAPLHAQATPPKLSIDISRTFSAGQYGVIHVSDRFTLSNNGTSPVSSLDFAVPRVYRGNVYYADAKDVLGNQLTLEADVNQASPFYWIRVHFANDLAPKGNYTFTVSSVVGGLLRTIPAGYQFNFTAAPILSQDVRSANVTFLAPTSSTFKVPPNSSYTAISSGTYPALIRSYKPWKALSNDTFSALYGAINQYILNLNSVERDIIIGDSGSLRVSEKYQIFNPSVTVASLTISLPDEAYNVMAYDDVGAMWAAPQSPAAPFQVTVQPRYTVGIRQNETFTFTLTYNVPPSKYISKMNWWGAYNLTFTLLDNRNDFLFKNAIVRIIAPQGISITKLQLSPQSPISTPIVISPDDRNFNIQGATSQTALSFGLAFSYVPFWSALGILPWIAFLEVALVALAIVMRFRKGPELAVPVPVEKLREFVGLYDERLALSRELVVMEEEVSRGGLVKHEFRRRRKMMEFRLDELNRSLREVKAELRESSARHDELIRRIDRAEAEIEVSRASLNQVRSQYRAGRSTRETYDAMTNDISKRIDRAEATIETTLITLREEAR